MLSVYWFGLAGGLATATAATLLFLADELIAPSPELAGGMLWLAAAQPGRGLLRGRRCCVTVLLRRERALAGSGCGSSRTSSPSSRRSGRRSPPPRSRSGPHLQFATAFTPADGLVAGDFFLVVDGPAGSTTVVVGDVVGHGLEAARCAAFVRAALATFARFTGDPASCCSSPNAALVEHGVEDAQFVTAVCLNICPPPGPRDPVGRRRPRRPLAAGHRRAACRAAGWAPPLGVGARTPARSRPGARHARTGRRASSCSPTA